MSEQTTTATLVHVDPATLRLATNVRTTTALDGRFTASIKAHGVLTPVVAVRAADGALDVRMGQRRTMAATEAAVPTIPVYVVGEAADAGEVERILTQVAENDDRTALGTADRAAAFEQLAAFGLTPGQIAKRTGRAKADVEASLAVAASNVAAAVSAKYDLTLDQAAVIAEFDEDPETVTALTAAAVQEPETFAHLAQRARDTRAEHQAIADLSADLAAQGIAVIERPGYDDKAKRLLDLATGDGDGDERTPLTSETHTTCPGRAAWINTGWQGVEAIRACTDPTGNGHVAATPPPLPAVDRPGR